MRIAEWIQLVFVSLLAATSWFRPLERARQLRVTGLALVAIAAIALARASGQWLWLYNSGIVRDWLPAALLLVPYWQIGQFFTGSDPAMEARLAAFDRSLFRMAGIRPSQTPIGVGVSTYLQLVYLLVYPLIPLGLVALYVAHLRQNVDYYWVVVLPAVNVCFATTPFVRALPPRMMTDYDAFPMPATKLGALNGVILDRASIRAITFPSAHVASSVAAALVLLRVEPWMGAIFLWIALSIAVATVVCGYHYAADVLLAIAIASLVFGVSGRFQARVTGERGNGRIMEQKAEAFGGSARRKRPPNGFHPTQDKPLLPAAAAGPGGCEGDEVAAAPNRRAHRAHSQVQPGVCLLQRI